MEERPHILWPLEKGKRPKTDPESEQRPLQKDHDGARTGITPLNPFQAVSLVVGERRHGNS